MLTRFQTMSKMLHIGGAVPYRLRLVGQRYHVVCQPRFKIEPNGQVTLHQGDHKEAGIPLEMRPL